VLSHLDAVKPDLLVIDSVQTIASAAVEGGAGGVTQVRAVAAALTGVAKERDIATVLVGHVTKDGSIAGPRLLEHLVDVVLHFEGDRHSSLRLVRAVKNRFGAADEVGCFALTDGGIEGLVDPSGLFLSRRPEAVAGTCVTVTVEGRRPLLAEVQALVGEDKTPNPRRAVSGLDSQRVAMVLAVVDRRGGVRLGGVDVYTATVGGVRLSEPACDLPSRSPSRAPRPTPPCRATSSRSASSGCRRAAPGAGHRAAAGRGGAAGLPARARAGRQRPRAGRADGARADRPRARRCTACTSWRARRSATSPRRGAVAHLTGARRAVTVTDP
jgi:DNA repair protein RadA/Sms